MTLTKKNTAPVNLCKACGEFGVCLYTTFASEWVCIECYKELRKLLGDNMDNRGGLKHSEAIKIFEEFCKSKNPETKKETVVFT